MRQYIAILALLAAAGNASAACEFDIEVGDSLVFSISEMAVESSCETVTVNLTHTGQLPAAAMGHNWVLTTDADFQPVATAGISAGPEANYLPTDDERILASTKLIGGGESTSVSFSIADLDASESYTFFCSFPGHWTAMKGAFRIV